MKNDDKVLDAIRGSVKKWSKIVHLDGMDRGNLNCPLCILFSDCDDCPVGRLSKYGCGNTPYDGWLRHAVDHEDCSGLKIQCPTCRELAQKELMFLQYVLEKWKEK